MLTRKGTALDFLTFLDEEEARAATTEQTVRGLQGEGSISSLDERKAKRQAIAQTILHTLKRMKPKD
jgi:hypothetical protein